MRSGETFTASRLAKLAGVGPETIRFYERKGLLPKPVRRSSGYREYSVADAKRIQFIKRAQELGFTLSEIQGLLDLRGSPKGTCADVKRRTVDKLNEVSAKIKDLKKLEKALRRVASTCVESNRSTSECPNVSQARANLIRAFALAEVAPRWIEWDRNDDEAPAYAHRYGSPSILVNGKDIAGELRSCPASHCRIYLGNQRRRFESGRSGRSQAPADLGQKRKWCE
jgi:MerR family mercuric resistance operon transcriptional regulator